MQPYYQDACVTLYHADCTLCLDWREPGGSLVTDPPYGIAYESGRMRTPGRERSIASDGDTALRDAVLLGYQGARGLVFGSWKRSKPVGTRMVLYWDTKGALGMGDLSLPWKNSTQEIYVLGDGFLGRRAGNVLRFPPEQAMGRLHPHQKPVDLMMQLVQSLPPESVVLDPFAGSGSTLVAAKQLGRRAVGVEVDEAYCARAAERLSQEMLGVA